MEVEKRKNEDQKSIMYQKSKKKAQEIREFYINLSLFCFFIPLLIAINLYFVPEFHWFWFSIVGWGTGLTFHGLTTFEIHPFMKNDWEERKIQQLIKKDLERERTQNTLKNQ